MRGIYWLADDPLDHGEGLSSMELISEVCWYGLRLEEGEYTAE
jgi:hypothetical protein